MLLAVLVAALGLPTEAAVVMHYSFDAGIVDETGNHNPSALSNVAIVPGRTNNGITVPPGGYFEIASSPALALQQFTVELWAKPLGLGPNEDSFGSLLVAAGGDAGTRSPLAVYYRGSDHSFGVHIGGAFSADRLIWSGPQTESEFHHLAITRDSSTLRLYVDGRVQASRAISDPLSYFPSPWSVGASSRPWALDGFSRAFNGVIDSLLIHDVPLSRAEIQARAGGGPADNSLHGAFVYWTDSQRGPTSFSTSLMRARLNGSEMVEILKQEGEDKGLTGIAFDPSGHALYLGTRSHVARLALDGSDLELLVPSLNPVGDVELDRDHGKIYWTEGAKGRNSVRRANLDGSSIETLVDIGSSGLMEGLALDPVAGKVYYTYNQGADNDLVRMMNLNGSEIRNLRVLEGIANEPHDIEIDTARGRVYWNEPPLHRIRMAALSEGTGATTVIETPLGALDAFHFDVVDKVFYLAANGATSIEAHTETGGSRVIVTNRSYISYIEVVRIPDAPGAPAILQQPASRSVSPGSLVRLSVSAGGESPLYYQWNKDAVPLPNMTNSILEIANFGPSHPGAYTVTVSNALGSVTSQVATLSVIQASEYQLRVHYAVSWPKEAGIEGLTLESSPSADGPWTKVSMDADRTAVAPGSLVYLFEPDARALFYRLRKD